MLHSSRYPPRDCMGKNFAQMEMRVILAHLFHKVRTEKRLYERERMRKSRRERVWRR